MKDPSIGHLLHAKSAVFPLPLKPDFIWSECIVSFEATDDQISSSALLGFRFNSDLVC